MGEEKIFGNLHPLDKYALFLFSYLKLNDVEIVDIVELAHTITQFGSNLYPFDLRETQRGELLADIDTMLMSAYIQGYLDMNTRKILLEEEYVKSKVVPEISKELGDIFKHISAKYVERMKVIDNLSTRSFIGDTFVNHNLKGRGRKNSD